jgi:hypothetical protein
MALRKSLEIAEWQSQIHDAMRHESQGEARHLKVQRSDETGSQRQVSVRPGAKWIGAGFGWAYSAAEASVQANSS